MKYIQPGTRSNSDLSSDMEQKPNFWNTAERKSLDDATPQEWDEVSRPARYTQGDIESWDAMHSAMSQDEWNGMCKGTIMKYLWREQHKGGKVDLLKARAWLEKWIATYDG